MQLIEPLSANALFSSKILIKQINDYLVLLENCNSSESLSKCIQSDFIELSNYYIAIGDQEFKNIEDSDMINHTEVSLLHYSFPESFKDIILLHRDVFLQLEIAKYKHAEGLTNDDRINAHFKASKEQLIKATDSFNIMVTSERDAQYQNTGKIKKQFVKIQHDKNPWGIYKGQFETVKKQINDINRITYPLNRAIKAFSDIKIHNTTFLSSIENDTEGIKKQLGEAIKMMKGLKGPDEIPSIISWIENVLKNIKKDENLLNTYTDTVETKIKTLGESTIPVSTNNGLLQTKTLNFNTSTKKWFDFEILPYLIDLLENKSNMTSFFKHSLLNLKSSLLVEKNNESLEAIPSQLQTLHNVHYSLSTNNTKLKEIVSEIKDKFESQFLVTNIFKNSDFLEVSLQSSITQFAAEQSDLLGIAKSKLKSRFANFNSKYEKSKFFSNQSEVETAIECINYRMSKEENAHYDSLFLNKNFIGDLFLLPRETQEIEFDTSLKQWQNGFNKAILVTGDSLSGKTTFTEFVAQKHFSKNAVSLLPNATITFNGRKFSTSKDLDEALQNIKKSSTSTRPLIVIDDLELWRDEKHSFLSNVRALISFVESESDEMLIVATLSSQLQKQLDNRLRFSEAFSTNINLDRASFLEIFKAVLIRHGASHKTLVNEELVTYTNKQIEEKVLKLARKLDFNIGEVLQAWTYGTTMIEDNKVVYSDKEYRFVDFFTSEESIILKYVFINKQINELILKGFLSNRYDKGYKSGLKRLINTKTLVRNEEGQLLLNSVITKDIKQILTYRGTIAN